MKKVFTLLFCLFYLFSITTAQATEIAPSIIQDWKNKLDTRLLKTMETTNEKIPVWLWMEDIDQNQVKNIIYKNTGLKETNLSVISESISDELVADLTNYSQLDTKSQQEVKSEMETYLERTKIARKLESQRVDTYLQELRTTQDNMLKKKNQDIFSQLGFSKNDILIEQTGAPVYVVQLTKDEIVKAAKNQKVTAIYYYDTRVTSEDYNTVTVMEGLSDNYLQPSIEATSIDRINREIGLEGDGIKVGLLEGAKTSSSSDPAFVSVTPTISEDRIYDLTYIDSEDDRCIKNAHATQVAEIVSGKNGLPPKQPCIRFL